MTDRLLNSVWWATVMGMILAAAGVAMFGACNGVLDLIGQRYSSGIPQLLLAIAAATAALQLCRYRNDLM
jgi:hypothetical protein